MIAFPVPTSTSCVFAGMATWGWINAAIPAAISNIPTIAIG